MFKMKFEEVLRMVRDSYEKVFWASSNDAKDHANEILKCATDIYIAQQGQTQIVIKREEK